MDTMNSDELINFVNSVLESVEIQDKDIETKANKSEKIAHRKVIDALSDEWNRRFKVYTQSDFEGYKIDFVGRQKERGKILLAVEVDLYANEKSWLKLADINATCKIWILLDYKWDKEFASEEARKQAWEDWLNDQHPEYRPEEFKKARRFWYSYGADAGELTVFVKSPDYLGSRKIFSSPP